MKKYENFCKALNNLEDIFKYEEPYDNVTLTGLVALFEICFEQSWKAMKEILETQGYSEGATGSPRQVMKTAYTAGMISDEDMWLELLSARNNATHAYNDRIALGLVRDIKTKYVEVFRQLRTELEEHWI